MNLKPYLLILPSLLLAACNGSNHSDSDNATPPSAAVVSAAAPDFTSGAVSLISTTSPFTATNRLDPSSSDISVRADGDHYFLLKRFGTDQISRYEAATPSTPTYTYSTNDPAVNGQTQESNPYDIIIASESKGYVIRYGAGKIWIVNPSATTEAAFKTGEIDLSQYAVSSDGAPKMSAGLIKNGKLYVALQRLDDSFAASQNGYVAVIDTATDTEVATYSSNTPVLPALKGIPLQVSDPYRLVSVPNSDAVLVAADGGYDSNFNVQYNGGIVSINPSNYAATLLLDDGDAITHAYGQFADLTVAANDRAYLVGSAGFGETQSLYRFNPSAVAPITPVAVPNFQNLELGPVSADAVGDLWLGQTSTSAPGITVLGFQNGAETVIAPLIDTVLNPLNIDFITAN